MKKYEIVPISKKKFEDDELNICHPKRKSDKTTCYTTEELKDLAIAVNKKLNKNIIIKHDKKYLLKELTKALEKECDTQICWVEDLSILNKYEKEKILKNSFLPKGPKKQFEWLSTTHIDDVMETFTDLLEKFNFTGTVPLDFDYLSWTNMKNLNFGDLQNKGITKLGSVFNLDESNKPGSHWVALYADLDKGEIYYYDSYGGKPPHNIHVFMDRIENYIKSKNKSVFRDYNRVRHQFGGSECGIYSIMFVLQMAIGKPFEDVCNTVIKDKDINTCRNILFRDSPDIGGNDNFCKKIL